jgi:hypothetical protein
MINKMKKLLSKLLTLSLVLAVILTTRQLFLTYTHHHPPKNIELVMPYTAIEHIAQLDHKTTNNILSQFKKSGLTSLSLAPASANIMPALITQGFHIVLRVENQPGLSSQTLDETISLIKTLPKPHTLIFEGPEVMGYPNSLPQVAQKIRDKKIQIGWVELYPQSGITTLIQSAPERIIRVHSIAENEARLMTQNDMIERYVRAAKERRIDMLFIHPNIDRLALSGSLASQNATYIYRLANRLKSEGFIPGISIRSPIQKQPENIILVKRIVALLIAIMIPIIAMRYSKSVMMSLGITSIGVAAISLLLASPEFQLGIYPFLGIKLALIIPILIVAKNLCQDKTISDIIKEPIRIIHLIGIAAIVFYLIRSGNGQVKATLPYEVNLRNWLEQLLIIRPRTKEILIGYPALFLFFSQRSYNLPQTYRWLVGSCATLALVSFVNTFCHAHIPLEISIYRSILGILLGYGVYHCYDVIIQLWQTKKPSNKAKKS